jgi:hypothetical protein
MKISERFELNANQFELDFVDIDTSTDIPLFLDPYFLSCRHDSFSIKASRSLRSFFQTFISYVHHNNLDAARAMFDNLHEPNETCLGLSSGIPRGNAIGEIDSENLFNSVLSSRAIQTGIVEDIEDFSLFIDGIGKDKISDMTTNIIRFHLINYTQEQCKLWGIPLTQNVQSGMFWDAATRSWTNRYTSMMVVEDKRILLTPKSIVSFAKRYTPQKYYNKFVLEFLQHENIKAMSRIVQFRQDGTPYVTKKDLKEDPNTAYSKEYLANFTASHPEVFADFKDWVKQTSLVVANEEICEVDNENFSVAAYLIDKLRSINAGNNDATNYHRAVVGILEFLFYPDLISPVVEREVHQGRKRIDLTFDNAANDGFFQRLHSTYALPSQFIFVECKNYTKDIANPEIDQLSGRFSLNRGKVGLLLFRETTSMSLLIERCADTYNDDRGLMIPLDDNDLIRMLEGFIRGEARPYEPILMEKYRDIALR